LGRIFLELSILPFDSKANKIAVGIYQELKAKNKLIEIPDILIAATALVNNIPLATINKKHFNRINGLHLL
jgi:predicted nucleic acid-binding protein